VLADVAELMGRGQAGNNGVVAHLAVTAECCVVGKDAVVSDLAIVGDMCVAEEQIVVADTGGDFFRGAAVDGGVFAEGVIVSDDEGGRLTDVFDVLGDLAYGGEGEKGVIFPNGGVTFNNDVGFDYISRSDVNVGSDDAVGSDFNVAGKLGGWINDCGGVDHVWKKVEVSGVQVLFVDQGEFEFS
jgi:hypothetical protein